VVSLNHCKDRQGKRIGNRKVAAEAEELLARLFGGCTCFEARGVYFGETGTFVKERIRVVESFGTDDELTQHLPSVRAFAAQMKLTLQQEAVALEINNVLELV